MKSKKIEFTGALGDKLSGRVDMPDGDVNTCALFAHCFTCSKNLKAVGNISTALTKKNIAVLRFDFTGLGESSGDFSDTNFTSNVDDLVAASNFMESQISAPSIIIGHSLGGAAVLQAANKMPTVKAVATIGAPANPGHVTHHFESHADEIQSKGEAVVTLAGRKFKIKKQFIDDLEATKMNNYIQNLERALLVMHSPIDDTVGVENAAHIYKMAKHPKSYVSLHESDHLLMQEKYSLYCGALIAEWSSIYL